VSVPQAENGHVDIANEIVEALCRVQLSGYESRVLWAIFRKTYGWHKKEDRISLSQFQVLTGLPLPKISNTLNRLALRKMVTVTDNGNGKTKSYGFQKVYSLWQGLPEKVIPESAIPVFGIAENGAGGLPESASTKETLTKEKITTAPEGDIPTRAEVAFLSVFAEKEPRLRELYPHADFLVQREICVAHYRNDASAALDPWVVILKWFARIPKEDFYVATRPRYVGRSGSSAAGAEESGSALNDEFCNPARLGSDPL